MFASNQTGNGAGASASRLGRVFRYCRDVECGVSFEQAFGDTEDAIVLTNAETGGADQAIIYVNRAFERMSGYDEEELIGESPRVLQGARTDPRELVRMRLDLARHGFFEGEIINYRRDSGEYLMEWAIAPVRTTAGKVRFWLSVQNDVTRELIAARGQPIAPD